MINPFAILVFILINRLPRTYAWTHPICIEIFRIKQPIKYKIRRLHYHTLRVIDFGLCQI